MSVYAPVVAHTASTLYVPTNLSTTTSLRVYPSPATMHTDTGLDIPTSKPTTTLPTIAASAHTERSRTELDGPGGTTTTSVAPTFKSAHTENTNANLDQPTTSKPATSTTAAFVHTERTKASLDVPGQATGEVTPSAHTERPGGPSVEGPTSTPTVAPSPVVAISQTGLQAPGSATALPQNSGDNAQPAPDAGLGAIIAGVIGGHGQSESGSSGNSGSSSNSGNGGNSGSSNTAGNTGDSGSPDSNGAGTAQGDHPASPAQGPVSPAQTYYAGSTPIVAGSAPIIVSGTTYSLAPSGTAFFVNGQQTAVPEGIKPASAPQQAANADSGAASPQAYIVSDTPVVAGGPGVVVAGTTYSVAPSGTAFFVNGQQTAAPAGATPASDSQASGAAVETYYISNTPVIAGGSGAVIGGTTYSLAPSGTAFYINGKQTSVPANATPANGTSGSAATTSTGGVDASGTASSSSASASSGKAGSSTASAAPAQQTDSGASELALPAALGLGAVGVLACLF